MALSTQPYKGARDFYPEDKRLQKYMFGVWRRACESFGYEEYDTPIFEPLELYLAKTGAEIVNEQTYTLQDRGGRQVVVRPEMTPSVSRLVAAKRQQLGYPLRLFNIGGRWRYERPQRGRWREFYQLDVDIFGVPDIAAERELIVIADSIFKSFGASDDMYSLKLNSRKFMDYVLGEYIDFDAAQRQKIAKLIDRMNKIDRSAFIAEADAICTAAQREAGVVERLLGVLKVKTIKQLPQALQSNQYVAELQSLLELLATSGVTNAEFDITVMRGFDYYTDIVFEVFDNHPDNNRAMFGGGRYDGLVGLFGVAPVPTVGFAMGDATMQNFLESHNLLPDLRPETDVYVAVIGTTDANQVASELRAKGLNVAVDLSGKKLGDQFKTADKKGIAYVLVVGEQEMQSGEFKLKNLASGDEQRLSIEAIVAKLKA